jgi:signal transduction histidine kinase
VRVDRATVTALLSATSSTSLYRAAVTAMRERLDGDRAVVALDAGGELEAVSVDGATGTEGWPHRWEDPADHRVAVREEDRARRLDDLEHDGRDGVTPGPTPQMDDLPVRSLLCVPFGDDGVLFDESTDPASFSEADREWLEELATYVAAGRSGLDASEEPENVSAPASAPVEPTGDPTLKAFDDRFGFVLEVTESLLWTLDLESGDLRLFGPVESIVEGADRTDWDVATFIESFVHPDDANRLTERIDRVVRGDGHDVEIEFRLETDSSGEQVWVRALAALPGADETTLVGLATDVTERVSREQRIKHLQQRTTRLISARSKPRIANIAVNAAGEALRLPLSGIHLRDGDRLEPTAVNERLWDEFGEMPTYHRDSDDPFDAFVWETLERGRPAVVEDTTDHDRLGETTIRSVIVYPLDEYGVFVAAAREPDAFGSVDVALGEVLAMGIVAALDRSEQEHRLREQAEELERKNERLEEFTSIVSHDLRNPLNVALGRVQYVRSQRDDEHLATAEQALERMEAIIEETLVLARQGHDVADRSPISLPEMATQCWQNVQTKDATLSTEFEGDYVVAADRERLAHVFENLFTNAVEHGSASPSSRARRDAAQHAGDGVTIRVGPLPDGAGFYVEDDGTGIPPSDRETVFETGYTTADDGTGFGLSLVRDIVEAHGWTIAVTAGSEGGARFEIRDVD